MAKRFLTLVFLAAAMQAFGQMSDGHVVASAGTAAFASATGLASAGEQAGGLASPSMSGNDLSQGFQQIPQNDLTTYYVGSDIVLVQMFPNPAKDTLHLIITTIDPNVRYSVALYDLPGHHLNVPCKQQKSGDETHLIYDLRQVAAATYMIVITDEHNTQVKTIKFTKENE